MTRERWIAWGWFLAWLVCLLVVFMLTVGCAALLPIGLGLQGAISAGSDVVGMVKWWEDRKFQQEALDNQRAMTTEIRQLRDAVERHQEEVRKLREGTLTSGPQP